MTEQLKPCPFCGSPARLNRSTGESLWSHDQVEWTQVQCTNEDCGVATENRCEGWEPTPVAAWNTRAVTTSQPAQAGEVDERVAFEAALSRDDFDRFREWFDCIQDVHGGYLDRRDYELAKKLYTALGMRVPSSINTRASPPTQPAAQATPEPDTCRKRPRCGRADPCAWLEKQATQQAAGEPVHHRQAWAALTKACQRVATADGSGAADLTRAIDRFTDVLMGDTHPAPAVPEPSINWFGTHFTYKNQPCDNVTCWRLGEAARSAKPGGDLIDHGLSLLHELEKHGYGVYSLAAAQAKGS